MLFRAMRNQFPTVAFMLAAAVVIEAGCGSGSSLPALQNNLGPVSSPSPMSSPSPIANSWLTNGLTGYVSCCNAALFPLPTGAISNAPGGAQKAIDAIWFSSNRSTETSVITYDIKGAATLPAGTKVTVSGYFSAPPTHIHPNQCHMHGGILTGSYAVGIAPKGGSIVVLAQGASAGWTPLSGSMTITTPGAYQAAWMVTSNKLAIQVLTAPPPQICVVSYVTAGGQATGLNVVVSP